jgi:tetratricopeptide (TPR) repeat protein
MFSIGRNLLVLFLVVADSGAPFAIPETPETNPQGTPSAASQPKPGNRVTSHDSVVVSAKLTPEEVEEGRLNDVYQEVYNIERSQDCDKAIEKYQKVVIPMAEGSKFPVPRSKFLFLAYRGIGDCYLGLKRYADAEQMFQRLFEYLPVWPGTEDSDYPINYRSVGIARMHQEHWKEAEEALQNSVSLFDKQIERAAKSDSEFMRNEHSNNLRMSQDSALNLLAVVYFREQRSGEALKLLERAYEQATRFHAPPKVVRQIVDTGLSISESAGEVRAMAVWFGRSAITK